MFCGRTILITAVVAVVTLLAAGDTLAFKTDGTRWTLNRTVVMHLSLGGAQQLQDGFTSFNESAADALSIWNQHLVRMRFAWVSASPLPALDGDADNSVLFSNTIFGDAFGSSTLAVTLISSRSTVLTETDVIFNAAKAYDSYRGPQQGSVFDFHRVALHEFGHVIGLDHPDQAGQTVQAIMNSRIGSLDSLQFDDIRGARSLYDVGPEIQSSNVGPNFRNLSTRAYIGTGENVMIGGFILRGSERARLVLRAIGNSLSAQGVVGANEDPIIELRDRRGVLLQQNDDWVDGADAQTIASYRLDPRNSREAAIFVNDLLPGEYTITVRGWENAVGVGLVELYDLGTSGVRAANISTRARVGAGNDVMVAGFIVGPTSSKDVIVRGIGPSLGAAGVVGALQDPAVQLVDGNGNVIGDNNNWREGASASEIQARGFAPSDDRESALIAAVREGNYTAVLRGVGDTGGVAVAEAYDLSPGP